MSLISSLTTSGTALIIEFSRPIEIISSIPPGHAIVKKAVFRTVKPTFDHSKYNRIISETRQLIKDSNAPVLLTAVDVNNFIYKKTDNPETHVILTIGLGHPACIEGSGQPPGSQNTINILVVTSTGLSLSGLVDLFKTTVEAKTAACADLLLKCSSRSIGTVTDAVVVGRPLSSQSGEHFAGIATRIGRIVSRMIYDAITSKGRSRSLDKLLYDLLGVDRKWLVNKALEIYKEAEIPGISIDEVESLIKQYIDELFRDPNIWAFIIGAREIDIHGISNTYPLITREEFLRDPHWIIADDIIGASLSMYLTGFKGLFMLYWIERLKKTRKIFPEKGVFTDDIISALLASILTRVYDVVAKND